ncbi:MAG TPA: FAD-dependent oxidoreductase [Acetobacteraceae bacterium]|jgi:3-(3-hydroxy-phenyl)propionate hydroxylase|nr:FAD-dependent oxidoreductase [Acetobacteraceae bacterium]
MQTTYAYPKFAYRPARDSGARHPVVIVGGGLVGLTVALDLAHHGVRSVLLDEDDTVSVGSRAICFAKRTLEIYGRLGIGARALAKGVTWNTGRVFFRDREVYQFNLLPDDGHEYPAFVNLQQYYVEHWLVEACEASGLVDLRWRSRIVGVENRPDGVDVTAQTPDGTYRLRADWLLACDGARSVVREGLGLPFVGQVFRDRFLIADVVMKADFPPERRFWFDPPFHPGGSVLLHRQADDVWRIDFQLGWDADPEAEKDPERVRARVRAMLGPDVPFELEWVSVYTFRCRRIERFVHGRTVLLGDAAHQVSPFGARGGNGGVQDADNLAWKLAAVLRGEAPVGLIETYDLERIPAADENILHSTRSTDFITPKSEAARAYRDAVLELSEHYAFARPLVNSGRLSRPAMLHDSKLNTPDDAAWEGGVPPGSPAVDAPLGDGEWLLRRLGGDFAALVFDAPRPVPQTPARVVFFAPDVGGGRAAARYDARPGTTILFRPDQHVAARWRRFDPDAIAAAQRRALMTDDVATERLRA